MKGDITRILPFQTVVSDSMVFHHVKINHLRDPESFNFIHSLNSTQHTIQMNYHKSLFRID